MNHKISKLIFAALVLLLVAGLGLKFGIGGVLSAPGAGGGEAGFVEFTVSSGESVAQIAQNLHQRGLIRSPLAFRLLVGGRRLGLQAGRFTLSPSMGAAQIAERLLHGTFDVKLTIIEGWRREETAGYLSSKLPIQSEDFLKTAEEGYMFPDTYLVPQNATAAQIAELMKKTFSEKVNQKMRDDAAQRGLAVNEVVALASIVEREAKYEEDRPLVAGILLKRLKNGWPLEADATVQYAAANVKCKSSNVKCEWWPKELTAEDLQTDSPYNTRRYRGLPPAPICSPGLSSLNAAAHPQESPYWFYVSDKAGKIYYAKTLDEHQENVVRYLR